MAIRQKHLFANWTTRKQMEVAWSIILAATSIYSLIPRIRPYTQSFYTLPYPDVNGQYLQGSEDTLFVLGWLVLMTAIRASIIEGVYQVSTWLSLMPKNTRMRFAEQGFLLFYSGTSFTIGMYLLMKSSYWLNFEELWSTWPSRQISGELKWYYLVQLSFWLQQILSINLEKRRKDYAQMSTHHVVTSVLMYIAYAYRWTKVGHVVLVIMDVVDFLLPLAKMLKYLKYENICNVMFGLFMATWIVARHGIYNWLTYSIYRDVPRVMAFACYRGATERLETDPDRLNSRWRYAEPFFDQAGTICLDQGIKSVFLGLLLMLQFLSIVWFAMIVKVAMSVVGGGGAEDTRSGDEEEEDDDVEEEEEMKVEVECASDTIGKIAASSSGNENSPRQNRIFQRGPGRIRVPGSRDRKELIGRVGCNG